MSNNIVNVRNIINESGTRSFAAFTTDHFADLVENNDPNLAAEYDGVYDPNWTAEWHDFDTHLATWLSDNYTNLEYATLLSTFTSFAALLDHESAGAGPRLSIDPLARHKLGFSLNNPETSWTTPAMLSLFGHLRFPVYIHFTRNTCWISLIVTPHPTDTDKPYIRTDLYVE